MHKSILFIICLAFSVLTPTLGLAATPVDISYSQRLIPNLDPPEPGYPEGAYIATFTADNPVEPAIPDTTLVKVNDWTYTFTFHWNETEIKAINFIDTAGDTTHVQAWPEIEFPFDPTAHTVPVIHIHTDSTHLWNPTTGIYAWGENENCLQHGSEWERPASWEFYPAGNAPEIDEPIGLRIHGGWSRNLDQKGLRFYFDDYGASNEINYDFFDGGPTSFRRLIIRTCRYPKLALNSLIGEGVFQDLGHLGSRFALTAVYLNEEFWGVYNLRERIDEEFIEHTHQLDTDGYILLKDGDPVHGDASEFYDFLGSFATPADYTSHDWFVTMQNQVDLTTYIDWLFLNIFGASADNGFDDNSVQLKVGNGKWQFLAWDEDDLFSWNNLSSNHYRFYAAADQTEWNQFQPSEAWFGVWTPELQQWCTMFNRLMQNSEFKALFANRVRELLGAELAVPALNERIDGIAAVQEPEMGLHFQRWDDSTLGSYLFHVNAVRSWIAQRHPIVRDQLGTFLDYFGVPVELSKFSATGGTDQVTVSWRTESESANQGFILYRSIGSPDAMVEIASYLTHPELRGQEDMDKPTEYEFSDTSAAINQVNYYQLHHVSIDQEIIVHNWIESAWPLSWDGLVLNELMADNESTTPDEMGEFDDWFEIYNGSDSTVYLDGMFVSDEPGLPTKHQLTGGHYILPGDHFLLWADNDLEQGPAHCGFKLSSQGEALTLFAPDGITLVDSVNFGTQIADVSFQRFPDGEAPWTYGATPTPAALNAEPDLTRVLVINEVMPHNVATTEDEAGDFDPWLELYNPLPIDLPLVDLTLSDQLQTPWQWSFPDTSIGSFELLVIWIDGEDAEGPLHTNFRPGTGGGWLGLSEAGNPEFIHTVEYPDLGPDAAWAQIPDGSGYWLPTGLATPGTTNLTDYEPPLLFINEFLASNDSVNQDEIGDFDDWVEIFNPGPEPVQMGGLFLTDDLSNSTQWVFPEVELAPGGFLLVWCDNDETDGPLHTSFKLGASGEQIGLYDRLENGNGLIDGLTFDLQNTDISEGRQIDGGLPWVLFDSPTPGVSNVAPAGVPSAGSAPLVLRANYPNPFNPSTTVTFALPHSGHVRLSVHDLRGHLVALLVDDRKTAGTHEATWDGRDRQGRSAPAGVYLLQLKVAGEVRTGRMVLIK